MRRFTSLLTNTQRRLGSRSLMSVASARMRLSARWPFISSRGSSFRVKGTRSVPPPSTGPPPARLLAGVAPQLGQVALELVDLLHHVDGDDDVVVLELVERARVVEEDV